MLIIESNGSKWAGEEPEGVDYLLATLAETPLDPAFEGAFVTLARRTTRSLSEDGLIVYEDAGPLYPNAPDTVCFFGNFWRRTSVFRIYTDEPETIARLTAAIRANQASAAYVEARSQRLPKAPPGERGQLTLFGAP